MAKTDVRECRDCRWFEIEFEDGWPCFSCKKGRYTKIHFFVDACGAFEDDDQEADDETD